VKRVPLSDGSTPYAGLDWRARAIARAVPVSGPWDEWFIPKFSHGARGGRLTPERLLELRTGSILRPKERDALLGMLPNREYALSWTWEELGTISDEVEPPYRIQVECGYKVWEDAVFRIPKKVIPVGKEMIEERVRQGRFEPAWGPYRNAHILVPKKNQKYRFTISAVSANRHTVEEAGTPPNIKELSEAFAGLPISSLIDFHSGSNQKMLHEDSRDYMVIQTMQGMYQPCRLVQGATYSVSAFVRVSQKILNAHLGSTAEIFVDDVRVKGPKSRYRYKEVEGLPGVRTFVMEHLQNIDNVLADVERAGATISGEKSDWCSNGVKIVVFVCGEAGRWPQVSKVYKVWNWPRCENRTECRIFLGLCIYYGIWIPEYAIVAGPVFQILRKDVEFQRETEEMKAMAMLKEALCNAPVSKTLDVSDGAGQIVMGVDASSEGWGAILQQEDKNRDRHRCHYERELWNKAEKRYDAGKRECRGLMKALKMFHNYVYGVRFLVETDANTLVHQLNLPANDLPGALVTRWIAWI